MGDDRSGEFVDLSRPAAVVNVMGVETAAQAERVLTEYSGEIDQFWRACNANHHLGVGDHRSYRKRVRDVELVYVTQAGQPYVEVWPDPVEEEDPRKLFLEILTEPIRLGPILIERPRKGFVIRKACYETPINEDTFNNYPPSLYYSRQPPISPAAAGPRDDILPKITEIEDAYAALSGEDAETYQLSRIISEEWTDQNGNDMAGYVTLCRVYQTDSQEWEERPAIEFPDMGLLPIEGEEIPPWFPADYNGPWAPPRNAQEAISKLTTEPVEYGFWPNSTSANLHDFFGAGAPLFQLSFIDQNGNEQFFTLGFGNRFDADPQGLPNSPLGTCGFTFEEQILQDPWGHPLEDNEAGIQENKYWPFAPGTLWTPFGQEITGPYPVGSDGVVPQEPPFEPMSDIGEDFLYWFNLL